MVTLDLIYKKAQALDAFRLEELYDFITFLLSKEVKGVGRKKFFPITQLEMPDKPSVYKGKPLSLADMDTAIEFEAGCRS